MSTNLRVPDSAVQAFLARRHGHFIDNQLVHADQQEPLRVYNPATGDVIAHVPDGTAADVDAAVRSARRAFEQGWGRSRPADRERLIWKLADLLEQHADELAQIETLNQGKSINLSRAVDVGGAVDWLRYAAGWATKIEGTTLDVSIQAVPGARWRAMTLREPIGVVGAIVPWNFPLTMAVWKIAPALASGCTVVLKPSEETPLTALRLAELCREAGLPPGVVNIVNGRGTGVGAALAAHPGIDKITFTGSTPVGKLIGAAALRNMTRCTLELGGKSPAIVLPDADLDRTAAGVAMGIFFNQGQVCTAGSRLLVHRSIYEPLAQRVAENARSMTLGPGMDTTAQINPVVSARQQQRVMGYVRQGVAEGARVLCGGTDHDGPGFYVKPTVLADVAPSHTVVREEIFGPVLAAMPFDSTDEALALANDSPYGLAASIWSNDHAAITALSTGLKAGTIWVNAHNVVDPNLPFGGFKQSGIGREHGRAMVEHYTETKSVLMAY